ncbi:efflux RND transporter periplasmic adaptor subunit [Sphingomonas sp. NFR15]|uniref:efflux RND transporter periplasmic adaptor subunit n=1 Tax=Sphingomonas sp. NFR15 TaxID=1566282 RepID=UPI00088F6C04|nr:efflux RND transporter periplasmic adaptor subunit [Sphingomonas sp. NFR15]SDA36420.1 RND family efflux transporter, MFP subunit [Sphingomonas sp. NFR15]
MTRAHLLWLGAGVLLAVLLLIGAAYFLFRPIRVTVVTPHRGPAVELVYATGFVEPTQPVAVAARFTAPVKAVLVAEGDTVRKGQALLTLDDTDLRETYAQAHAQSVGATLAERRIVTLFGQGWTTGADRDAAVANGEAARAAERTAAAKLGQNVVRAGIDGIVIKQDIQPGELAVPTRTLMLLGDPRRARVTATVDERDIPRVHVGQRALISSDAWPGRVIRAHVAELTPTGDPEQRAFRARLLLDDGPVLPLGLSLEVNIVTRSVADALLLPASAIDGDGVWLVIGGRAHRQRVGIGIQGPGTSEVRGIAPDARVIDAPGGRVQEGTRVAASAR